ncbi:MAG: hypothetical protein AAFQ98_26365, partial [Bacteroidota bacterium]
HVRLPSATYQSMQLVDNLGKVHSQASLVGKRTLHLDTRGYPQGIFFLILTKEDGTHETMKMIK